MTEPIVKELQLPPGADGNSHPDYRIDESGEPIVVISPCGGGLRIAPQGQIVPHHSRSIAWLWGESKMTPVGLKGRQKYAWDEAARGNPAYVRLPVVGFKPC